MHKECRCIHIHPISIREVQKQGLSTGTSHHLRSHGTRFDLEKKICSVWHHYRRWSCIQILRKTCTTVQSCDGTQFWGKHQEHCVNRNNEWAADIGLQSRILSAIDLPAAEVMYRHKCNKHFCAEKNIPSIFNNQEVVLRKRPKLCQPKSATKSMAFEYAIQSGNLPIKDAFFTVFRIHWLIVS